LAIPPFIRCLFDSPISRSYRIPEKTLIRLNHLTSPTELFVGVSLIIPVIEQQPDLERGKIIPRQSLLELAVLSNSDTWTLFLKNNLLGSWSALPNDVLRLPRSGTLESENPIPGALPESITSVNLDPLMPKQGKTVEVKIVAPKSLTIKGSLVGYDLHFYRYQDSFVALQGIPAMLPPGLYPLDLEGEFSNGEPFAFSQMILIRDAEYPYDPALSVAPETVDPAVTVPEKEMWAKLGIPATSEKFWDGQFGSPVPTEFTDCWTSRFGNRRSYNGGTYDSFHSGLDFCGRVGTELYAVAPGKVVYTGSLTVRGGVVVIDHGWGVYTAYDHLSDALVKAGDTVQTGQVIGLGGATGRTTGPHLHWEVWAGGVQVDPVDWLQRTYP
jgi:murein DD-endopeptidase MepM/ murein hydrolase activator NlpD